MQTVRDYGILQPCKNKNQKIKIKKKIPKHTHKRKEENNTNLFFFLDQGLVIDPGWPRAHDLLPRLPVCWDYRCEPPHSASIKF
jgi:hypothetical protein